MSFWNRIFRRDEPPASDGDEPKLNEDWAEGDQALCLVDFGVVGGPLKGEIYIVATVMLGIGLQDRRPTWGLSFRNCANLPGTMGYHASHFIKIVPRADNETTDIGLSDLIKHCNPAPVKADG